MPGLSGGWVDPHLDQVMLCNFPPPPSHPWLVYEDAYSLLLGRREIGGVPGLGVWGRGEWGRGDTMG